MVDSLYIPMSIFARLHAYVYALFAALFSFCLWMQASPMAGIGRAVSRHELLLRKYVLFETIGQGAFGKVLKYVYIHIKYDLCMFVHVCMYTYMNVYIYICIHIYTHTYTRTQTHTHTYTCECNCINANTNVCMFMHTHIRVKKARCRSSDEMRDVKIIVIHIYVHK